jgi:hypothetical protein
MEHLVLKEPQDPDESGIGYYAVPVVDGETVRRTSRSGTNEENDIMNTVRIK